MADVPHAKLHLFIKAKPQHVLWMDASNTSLEDAKFVNKGMNWDIIHANYLIVWFQVKERVYNVTLIILWESKLINALIKINSVINITKMDNALNVLLNISCLSFNINAWLNNLDVFMMIKINVHHVFHHSNQFMVKKNALLLAASNTI